jgi:hypothetical protein
MLQAMLHWRRPHQAWQSQQHLSASETCSTLQQAEALLLYRQASVTSQLLLLVLLLLLLPLGSCTPIPCRSQVSAEHQYQ